MKRETSSFRLTTGKKKKLDAIAANTDRDRSYLLNEAIDAYLLIPISRFIIGRSAGVTTPPGRADNAPGNTTSLASIYLTH
jgi:hypothetical protein